MNVTNTLRPAGHEVGGRPTCLFCIVGALPGMERSTFRAKRLSMINSDATI